jgi:hypothetical protein
MLRSMVWYEPSMKSPLLLFLALVSLSQRSGAEIEPVSIKANPALPRGWYTYETTAGQNTIEIVGEDQKKYFVRPFSIGGYTGLEMGKAGDVHRISLRTQIELPMTIMFSTGNKLYLPETTSYVLQGKTIKTFQFEDVDAAKVASLYLELAAAAK